MDKREEIIRLWQAITEQNKNHLAQFFTIDAQIIWPNTNEHFDLPAYLRANCDYPGQWSGRVEKIAADGSCSVARVWSRDGAAARAVTFTNGEMEKSFK